MDKWGLRALVYRWFRRVYPIRWFFQSEQRHLENLVTLLDHQPERIADLGTGLGETLPLLPGGRIRILLDQSQAMLKRAQTGPTDARVIGDILSPPLKPGSFDLVTCIGTSEYIPAKALLLQEMYTLLKPGGYALITFSPRNLYSRLRNLLGKRIYPLSGSTAYDLLAAEGFYIVRAYRTKMQSQYLVQKIV